MKSSKSEYVVDGSEPQSGNLPTSRSKNIFIAFIGKIGFII